MFQLTVFFTVLLEKKSHLHFWVNYLFKKKWLKHTLYLLWNSRVHPEYWGKTYQNHLPPPPPSWDVAQGCNQRKLKQSDVRSCRRLRVVLNNRPPQDLQIKVRPMRVHLNRVPVRKRAAAQLCAVPLESRTTLLHPLPCTQGEQTVISFERDPPAVCERAWTPSPDTHGQMDELPLHHGTTLPCLYSSNFIEE